MVKTLFNREALLQRLLINRAELHELIDAGLLTPQGWRDMTSLRRLEHYGEGFKSCVWQLEEISKYEKIRTVLHERSSDIFQVLNTGINWESLNSIINEIILGVGR